MNLLFTLAAVLVLALSSAIPLEMLKDKKGDEKAMLLNTDRDGHVVKRAKEVLMFGNQQNSPRLKKSDPEKELLSTSDKSSSSTEGDTEEGEVIDKSLPESGEDRSSELLNVDKIIQQAEANSPDSDSDADREALPLNDPEDNREAVREAVREANIAAHQEADREAVREAVREANLEARHKADREAVREAVREANLEADHKANLEAHKADSEAENEADGEAENEAVREAVREANIEARHKAENEAVREAVREANHEASLETANEASDENKSGSSDADGQLGDDNSQQLGDDDDDDDNSQLLAVQSIPVSLGVDDAAKTLAGLNKVSLDKQTPLLTNQVEGEAEKEFPDLGEQLEAEKPVDYDEILREYEHANAADLQRQQALHSSPFLNYIYRKEMEGRPQRTKRELLLPEDAERYLKGGIPEKLVTLESWPNAYSQSELLEKEAPYQIVDKPHFEGNVGYGYQKRSRDVNDEVDEDVAETVEPEVDEEVPYEEVVLNGRPGYFIPAKREFFPYSEEPVSHYSGLVDKRKDEVDYARLLRLARALAIQHDDNSIFSQA